MLIHTIFDVLSWLAAGLAYAVLRRTWFTDNAVGPPLRLGYAAAVLFGAGLGAWLFGTANLWLSGIYEIGRSIEGALAGAILAVELYKRSNGIVARTGAIYALPAALGIAIGRIGCQLSGLGDNTYGLPTGLPWGWDHGDGINRHPVAFYESAAMALFACAWIAGMLRGSAAWRQNGFYYLVIVYGAERFTLEFYKPYGTLIAGLGLFQVLSLILMAYGAAMIASNRWTTDSLTSTSG